MAAHDEATPKAATITYPAAFWVELKLSLLSSRSKPAISEAESTYDPHIKSSETKNSGFRPNCMYKEWAQPVIHHIYCGVSLPNKLCTKHNNTSIIANRINHVPIASLNSPWFYRATHPVNDGKGYQHEEDTDHSQCYHHDVAWKSDAAEHGHWEVSTSKHK